MEEKPTIDRKQLVKRNAKGQLEKGSILNPEGTKLGSLHFNTEMDLAIDEYAKLNNMTSAQVKLRIYMKGAGEALKGEYSFYRDYMDRKHGKPIQPNEHTGKDGGAIQVEGVEITVRK